MERRLCLYFIAVRVSEYLVYPYTILPEMAESRSSISSPVTHLSSIVSQLRSPRFKVVVCRNLGPDVMPLLESRHELEARPTGASGCSSDELTSCLHSWSSGQKTAFAIENGC